MSVSQIEFIGIMQLVIWKHNYLKIQWNIYP